MFNRKEYDKEYRKNNKDERVKQAKEWRQNHLEYRKQYYQDNREEEKKKVEQWRRNNSKHKKEYNKKYRKEHMKSFKEYMQLWCKNNKEKIEKQIKRWRKNNREKVNQYSRKADIKRRQLGFIPLNKTFENCEGHHISENFVIYIPKELHQSIWHNIWTWENMNKINKLAIEFLICI